MDTREEDVEAASDGILPNQYVEDVEGDFVEEVADDLEDEGRAFVARRQRSDVFWKHELLENIAHGG